MEGDWKEFRKRLKRSRPEDEEEDTEIMRAFKKAVPALRLETEQQEKQIMAVLRSFNSRQEELKEEMDEIRANLDAAFDRARNFRKEIDDVIGKEILERWQKKSED
ncbi:hypothetical protein M9H77_11144 [Catharanthus roseus]|uniref:Uncharacterized protein n=1 Tax=Catharanthus roseus TaxID=4058 RepID=A0ACC0BDS1_CATRO|nr:hypothetical protein M9H77_11144 [Catharanthus roseus]